MASGPCGGSRGGVSVSAGLGPASLYRGYARHIREQRGAGQRVRGNLPSAGPEERKATTHNDAPLANLDARPDTRCLDDAPRADRDVVTNFHRVVGEGAERLGPRAERVVRRDRRSVSAALNGGPEVSKRWAGAPLVRLVARPEDDILSHVAVPPHGDHDPSSSSAVLALRTCARPRRARTAQVPPEDAPVSEDRLAGEDDVLRAGDGALARDEVARVGLDEGGRRGGGGGGGAGHGCDEAGESASLARLCDGGRGAVLWAGQTEASKNERVMRTRGGESLPACAAYGSFEGATLLSDLLRPKGLASHWQREARAERAQEARLEEKSLRVELRLMEKCLHVRGAVQRQGPDSPAAALEVPRARRQPCNHPSPCPPCAAAAPPNAAMNRPNASSPATRPRRTATKNQAL